MSSLLLRSKTTASGRSVSRSLSLLAHHVLTPLRSDLKTLEWSPIDLKESSPLRQGAWSKGELQCCLVGDPRADQVSLSAVLDTVENQFLVLGAKNASMVADCKSFQNRYYQASTADRATSPVRQQAHRIFRADRLHRSRDFRNLPKTGPYPIGDAGRHDALVVR